MQDPFLNEISLAFAAYGKVEETIRINVSGAGSLASYFDVTGLATASIGAAGAMLARYFEPGDADPVIVDRRLASLWFGMTLRPIGWQMPTPWDPFAGDYRTADGWIRVHTNAPHHRDAALSVLGAVADRKALASVVENWDAAELEKAIVGAGGCAALMRDLEAWKNHPQGHAVTSEPLIHWRESGETGPELFACVPGRPLAGVKVLDLTRVLAGPVAGRFLAAYGAELLRIDPPVWEEPGVVPEVTLGKRCAGLDLKTSGDRGVFEKLLSDADILLHGYRADALMALGYGPARLRELNPRLIDVSLNAYGWTGPWVNRRGFDSLVQMSSGIADYGMRTARSDRPQPLPVQALDHATGYLMAAAALCALNERKMTGRILSAKLSLARVAHLLAASKSTHIAADLPEESALDIDRLEENTHWGPAHRIRFPLHIAGINHGWDHAAGDLRSAPAQW